MFSTSAVIEDDEARALMAARAIKSCEDTLVNLQQLQLKSSQEAKLESRRIREAKQKIRFLKGECDELEIYKEDEEEEKEDEIKSGLKEATMELQVICQKVRDHFAKGSEASVVELAERIDELVEKVISLELTVSSQGAQIQRLRTDTDELQKYLKNLEEEDNKGVISEDTNQFQEDLKKAEEDLQRIEQLERNLKDEKGIIQTHFNEACNSFANLSDQLNSPKGKTVISEFGDSYSTVTDVETVVDSTVLQLLIGMEGKDGKSVLDILRNFKDTRKLVLEIDRKNQELNSETMAQVRELKSANQMKDEEIQSLRKTLSLIQANFNNNSNNISSSNNNNNGQNLGEMLNLQNIEGIMEMCEIEQNHVNSEMESKLRGDIDTLLEENLDFWLRFSTSYHQIQDFQSQFEELRAETDKIKDLSSEFSIGNEESTPVEKRLRELNTDLQVWLEKNLILKSELENRSDSLNKLKDEISKISKELDSTQFTPYQNAKFQGEISNMQQENNKVAKELKTGLDHVRNLQVEIGKELLKLRQSFEIANSSRSSGSYSNLHHHFRNLSTKARIPLRTFLFGTKPKKPSLFNCMNPALQKQYSDLRAQPGFHT
ncbi:hypothetical protein LUZ60_011107 [Juncus effusus]|nr:hypothetical protein LUZ60_011107 [Juncus effusus]